MLCLNRDNIFFKLIFFNQKNIKYMEIWGFKIFIKQKNVLLQETAQVIKRSVKLLRYVFTTGDMYLQPEGGKQSLIWRFDINRCIINKMQSIIC